MSFFFLFFTISIQVAALKCVESPESLILINTISSGRCQCQGVNSNWRACTVQACDEQAAAAGWLAGRTPWSSSHLADGHDSTLAASNPLTSQQHQHQHAVDSTEPVPGGPYSLLHLRPHQVLLNFIRPHRFKQPSANHCMAFSP